MSEKRFISHISPEGRILTMMRERERKKRDINLSVFGEAILNYLDSDSDESAKADAIGVFRNDIRNRLADDSVDSDKLGYFFQSHNKKTLVKDGGIHVSIDQLTDDELIKCLRDHKHAIEEIRENGFEDELLEFTEFLEELKSNYDIETLDVDRAVAKIVETDIIIVDALLSEGEMVGESSLHDATIKLTFGAESELDRKLTLRHELFHVVSGTVPIVTGPRDTNSSSGYEIGFRKSGIRHNDDFRWLNEAVTQSLALASLGQEVSEDDLVFEEINLLNEMIAAGIPPDLFYAAYFEEIDFSGEDGKTKGAPAMRLLVKAIHEKMGRGYLKTINKKFEEKDYLYL